MKKKEEIIIKSDKGEDQLSVVLFPKNQPNKVDCVCLCLRDLECEEQKVYMTPDEACEIAGLLMTGVQFYLFYGNKDYKKMLKDRAEIALKRLKRYKIRKLTK